MANKDPFERDLDGMKKLLHDLIPRPPGAPPPETPGFLGEASQTLDSETVQDARDELSGAVGYLDAIIDTRAAFQENYPLAWQKVMAARKAEADALGYLYEAIEILKRTRR